MTEVVSRLAEVEADVQGLVEAHMQTLRGVRFLATKYSTGPCAGGQIDSLGLDDIGSLCIVGDFTRYDVHAMREQRRSIDLVRYRGSDLLGLETVASESGGIQVARWAERPAPSDRQLRSDPTTSGPFR